jgi:branched-chain amino acid transport system substrate-binding protein
MKMRYCSTCARIGWNALFAAAIASCLSACAANVSSIPFATSALGDTKSNEVKTGGSQPTARIALILPQGGFGPTAVVAKGMKQAVELALFEKNNPNIRLIVKDDRGTQDGAQAAATEALNEGAEIILGPLNAVSVTGAANVARARNVPVVAFSNDVKVAGNGVFLMSFLAEQETQRIVAFAASQGKRRFAAFIPDTPYGQVVEPAFRAAVAASGGTIVALERYAAEPNQMLEPSRRVFAAAKGNGSPQSGADALFLPGGQDLMVHVGPLLTYAGLDTTKTKLLGTGMWDHTTLGRDQVFLGAWYPAPDMLALTDFSQRFAKTFGAAPPRLATLAYDAANMAMSLAGEPPAQRYTAASLSRPGGFAGVDGVVRFNAGGLPDRSLAVHEVQAFGTRIISPVPGSSGGLPAAEASTAAPSAGPASWVKSVASTMGLVSNAVQQ